MISTVYVAYAQALRGNFKEDSSFFSFMDQWREIKEALNAPEPKSFFLSPLIPLEDKKQVLEKILNEKNQGGKELPLLRSFLFLLLDQKRWAGLNVITNLLEKIERKQKKVILAEVVSAHPLSKDFKAELVNKLEKFFNKKVLLQEKPVDPTLIGGIKVYSEGLVLDNTLLFYLTHIESQIRRNIYDQSSQ